MMTNVKLLEKLISEICFTAQMTNVYGSIDNANLRDNCIFYGQFRAYVDVYRALTKNNTSFYEAYREGEYILIGKLKLPQKEDS